MQIGDCDVRIGERCRNRGVDILSMERAVILSHIGHATPRGLIRTRRCISRASRTSRSMLPSQNMYLAGLVGALGPLGDAAATRDKVTVGPSGRNRLDVNRPAIAPARKRGILMLRRSSSKAVAIQQAHFRADQARTRNHANGTQPRPKP